MIASAVVALALACAAPAAGWLEAVAAAAVVAAVLAVRWLPRRGDKPLVPLAALAAAVSLIVDLVVPAPVTQRAILTMSVELIALVVLVALVVRRASARYAIGLGLLTSATAIALPLRYTLRLSPPRVEDSVVLCVACSLAVTGAVVIGGYLRRMDRRNDAAVRAARHAQRLELAGDLHDFVAHDISGIVVAAQSALYGPFDPEQARTVLQRIEQAGLQALSSMDQTVHALRDSDGATGAPRAPHGLADLAELVDRFAAMGTARAHLDVRPDVDDAVSREVADTAYRIVAEALTNVRRHAPSATHVQVTLALTEHGWLRIEVTDDGTAATTPRRRRSGGTGLAGLSERVAAFGGMLHTESLNSGWRLSATLPAHPPADRRTAWTT